jgi:WD40 repeat protein
MNTKMICFFENFQVQEIDLRTKEIEKSYNLQEIEGFEISEDAEMDLVIATALEKDVQLLGVACVDTVHIFEYTEEDENSLAHVTKIEQSNVS